MGCLETECIARPSSNHRLILKRGKQYTHNSTQPYKHDQNEHVILIDGWKTIITDLRPAEHPWSWAECIQSIPRVNLLSNSNQHNSPKHTSSLSADADLLMCNSRKQGISTRANDYSLPLRFVSLLKNRKRNLNYLSQECESTVRTTDALRV